MTVLLLGLLAYSLPGDTNIYAGMDANIAQFSSHWEWVYETASSGFRTTQGCIDMKGWYQVYEAKTEAAANSVLSMRYRFYMVRDYDSTVTEHRFEPSVRVWRNMYAHLVIVPHFLKKEDEAGVGLAWRRGSGNWLAVYAVLEAFDHNFSLMHDSPGPERDPFRRIPKKFELDARGELDWLRVRGHCELGTQAEQYLDCPDTVCEVWERNYDKSRAWGRLELRPVANLWLGSRLAWARNRSRTRWPTRETDTLTADTLLDFWVEPFVSVYPTERLELRLEYRMWDTRRGMDSLSYYSDWDILSTLASWHPLAWLLVEAGYQRSVRYRYNNDTLILEPWKGRPGQPQSRLLFNLEFRLRSGMMLVVKEGLEMDRFPRDLFRSPHNHTYVSLYLPLGLSSD